MLQQTQPSSVATHLLAAKAPSVDAWVISTATAVAVYVMLLQPVFWAHAVASAAAVVGTRAGLLAVYLFVVEAAGQGADPHRIVVSILP